jgi:hypothetical protein
MRLFIFIYCYRILCADSISGRQLNIALYLQSSNCCRSWSRYCRCYRRFYVDQTNTQHVRKHSFGSFLYTILMHDSKFKSYACSARLWKYCSHSAGYWV